MVKARKKLIEVALPLEAINDEGSRRKRKAPAGYPTTLHKWWAQRPVAAARAVIFSQLVDDPSEWPDLFPTDEEQQDERLRLFKIIEDIVLWDNTSNDEVFDRARSEILKSWRRSCTENSDHPNAISLFDPQQPPSFHDPFAGGGTLPLEAQRLGLEAYATDLNPVAVLINKAMIEFPPKVCGNSPVNPESRTRQDLLGRTWARSDGLIEDIRYYARWMHNEAKSRIGHLYPEIEITSEMASDRPDLNSLLGEKLNVVAWLWARTVKSPNPAFNDVEVPLASTFMLSTKAGKEVYVEPVINGRNYNFVVRTGKPKDFELAKSGTKISRGAFRCLLSDTPFPYSYIDDEANSGRMGARLMAIVAEGKRGRVYLSPSSEMEAVATRATPAWRPKTPARGTWASNAQGRIYGFKTFADYFTNRQLVALNTFSDLVHEVHENIIADAIQHRNENEVVRAKLDSNEYADIVCTYLSFAISRAADYSSSLATWRPKDSAMRSSLAKQAIPMTWDFAEGSIFGDSSAGFIACAEVVANAVKSLFNSEAGGFASQQDAAQKPTLPKDVFVISTDPPYYDNISYADLSDFLYVWLRRSLSRFFPDLFATMTVPKAEELIATAYRHGGEKEAGEFFLRGMTAAMHQLSEKAHPAFPVTIYYAFKQAEEESDSGTASTGWETFLEAVIASGFCINGTWPMRTEGDNRQAGIGANALASSIVLVCRKRPDDAPITTRRDFLTKLKDELPSALTHLQRGNIAPVDLAQAAIGPGMAVYTRFAKVLDAEGKVVSVRDALALINEVLDEALAKQESDFDADTRWALVWFEQVGFNEGAYGEAETLSKAKNTTMSGLVHAGILSSKGNKVRLFRPADLPADWNPTTDTRLSVWEIVHHLIRVLEADGEAAAARIVAALGSKAEVARELAYRLYTLCERKKRATEAMSYNGLVQSWPEILRLSRDMQPEAPAQGMLI